MDKRSENRKQSVRANATTVSQPMAASAESTVSSNWWMYHGDPAHTGLATGSEISSANVGASLKTLYTLELDGPVLSVPAIVDGYVYVGVANSHSAVGENGGAFHKINLESGQIEQTFNWNIDADERDSHGFTGMGCTPAISGGKIYFSAFNGKFYCLDQQTLGLEWVVDLRHADLAHNQPITNIAGVDQGYPPAAGWSSPVVADGRVYVSIGEGENPFLYSFVFCLDTQTGKVIWIFCTCQYQKGVDNQPNVLPAELVDPNTLPPGFTRFQGKPIVKGSSVWSSIAYDPDLNRLFCATGNPQPDSSLPSSGYSNGLISLDAGTGAFQGFFQVLPSSLYRPSDVDVDIGGSPTLFPLTLGPGHTIKAVGIGCKNGGYFVLAADSLQLLFWRQLLPYYNDGTQIPTVDPHSNSDQLTPHVTNAVSNATSGENYSGMFGTAAIHPGKQLLFIGIGGPNYHSVSPGIDSDTTPFMRALNWNTLADAWPLDDNNPHRYLKARPPMYTTPAECGLSSPAVVNDVVFCTTTKVSIYAFNVADGSLLWQDDLGEQTGGYNGGYGYCMGPAVWGDYVVAGGLIFGRSGGILRIYKLQTQ